MRNKAKTLGNLKKVSICLAILATTSIIGLNQTVNTNHQAAKIFAWLTVVTTAAMAITLTTFRVLEGKQNGMPVRIFYIFRVNAPRELGLLAIYALLAVELVAVSSHWH